MLSLTIPPTGVDLDRIIKVFRDPNSSQLHERLVSSLNLLCKFHSNGFLFIDVPRLQQIFNLSLSFIQQGVLDLVKPLIDLVRLLSKPFIKKTATDEVKSLKAISGLLASLSNTFTFYAPKDLQREVAQTLLTFSEAYGNRPTVLDLDVGVSGSKAGNTLGTTGAFAAAEVTAKRSRHQVHANLINDSGICISLVERLLPLVHFQFFREQERRQQDASAMPSSKASSSSLIATPPVVDPSLLPLLLKLLLSLSFHTGNCDQLFNAGLIQAVALLLSIFDIRNPSLSTTLSVLWNLLERLPQAAGMISDLPSFAQLLQNAAHAAAADAIGTAATADADGQHDVGSIGQGLRSNSRPPSTANPPPAAATVSGPTQMKSAGWSSKPEVQYSISFAAQAESDEEEVASIVAAAAEPLTAPSVVLLAQALSAHIQAFFSVGFRKIDRETRNDAMVVTTILLSSGPPEFRAACYHFGLLHPLLAAATFPELHGPSVAPPPTLLGQFLLTWDDPLDYELRQLVWGALPPASLYPRACEFLCGNGLLEVLLQYATLDCGEGSGGGSFSGGGAGVVVVCGNRWNLDQALTLRAGALACLTQIAPFSPPEIYIGHGGPAQLVRFIDSCGHAAHLDAALNHVLRLVEAAPAEFHTVFGAAGLLPVLIRRLKEAVGGVTAMAKATASAAVMSASADAPGAARAFFDGEQGPAGSVVKSEEVARSVLLCLNGLCKGSGSEENRRRLRKAGGVEALATELNRLSVADHSLPSPFGIALLSCIWESLVPDLKSLALWFTECNGTEGLLDLLEAGGMSLRPVLLGILSDVLELPRLHAFFHAWRSRRNGQSAGHLLLNIWREGDTMLGLSDTSLAGGGCLANTATPLRGTGHRTTWIAREHVAYGNLDLEKTQKQEALASLVTPELLFSKIWAVFRRLGFDSLPYLDEADRVTLCFIEKYVKFRQGEIWRGIQDDFEAEGMQPTARDRERLQSGIELCEHLAAAVRRAQQAVQGQKLRQQADRETAFLTAMQAQQRLEHEARQVQKDRSTMTLAELRDAKKKKETMLRNSIHDFKFMDNYVEN